MTPSSHSVESILDEIDSGPTLPEEEADARVVAIVTHHASEEIAQAVESRIERMSGPAGPVMVRLIEAVADADLNETLADYLATLPELPPMLLRDAVDVLEGSGCIEANATLVGLREDLDAYFDEDAAIRSLVDQIEEDPEAVELVLDGLWLMEPESREEILASMADHQHRPSVRNLLDAASKRKAQEGLNGRL